VSDSLVARSKFGRQQRYQLRHRTS